MPVCYKGCKKVFGPSRVAEKLHSKARVKLLPFVDIEKSTADRHSKKETTFILETKLFANDLRWP